MSISQNHMPIFDGTDYKSWSILMSGFLVSADDGKQWDITEEEWKQPTRLKEGSTTEYEPFPRVN